MDTWIVGYVVMRYGPLELYKVEANGWKEALLEALPCQAEWFEPYDTLEEAEEGGLDGGMMISVQKLSEIPEGRCEDEDAG